MNSLCFYQSPLCPSIKAHNALLDNGLNINLLVFKMASSNFVTHRKMTDTCSTFEDIHFPFEVSDKHNIALFEPYSMISENSVSVVYVYELDCGKLKTLFLLLTICRFECSLEGVNLSYRQPVFTYRIGRFSRNLLYLNS